MSEAARDPFNVVFLAVGAVMLAAAVIKWRAWLRYRYAALAVMAFIGAVSGAGILLSMPVLRLALARATGIVHLSTFIVYTAFTLFGACAITLSLLWAPPGRREGSSPWAVVPFTAVRQQFIRRVLSVYGITLPLMTVLFILTAPSHGEDRPFDTGFTDRVGVLLYLALYHAGFLWALWTLGRMAGRRAAAMPATHRSTRTGLWLLVAACAGVAGYSLCKVANIAAAALGSSTLDSLGSTIGQAIGCLGALLAAAAWVSAALTAWLQRRSDYRALHPLWLRSLDVDARFALDTPLRRLTEHLTLTHLEWRLTRRTREIRDAQLALSPWVSPTMLKDSAQHASAAGLSGPEHDAAVAACAFLSALQARNEHQPPADSGLPVPGLDIPPSQERAHLVAVARHLTGHLPQQTKAVTA